MKELDQVKILERSLDVPVYHVIFPEKPGIIAEKIKEVISGSEQAEQQKDDVSTKSKKVIKKDK